MNKLNKSIPSTGIKLLDLYNKIDSGILVVNPDFQRKLVWKKHHKYAFIETILYNFPFPEVYIASLEMDVENLKASEIVVDGQQRLTTIVEYIKGINDFKDQNKITPFEKLSIEEKKDFLNYSITVKDLQNIGKVTITQIFKRINSTDYSLNSNEILNAQFGDGEFAIFSKQLVDLSYEATEDKTDIILPTEERELIANFFKEKKIFSENDINRMFDTQYIMLIAATILEGKYFSRSSNIDTYLRKYNGEFSIYKEVLEKLFKSITLINKLNLTSDSYWFNKANLFSLIIELSKIDTSKIVLEDLERALLDLENKVDVYFNGDEEDIKLLTADETKFFEVSRHGSHELAAREHRGKVIRNILQSITNINTHSNNDSFEDKNLEALLKKGILFAKIIPTPTGLKKGIMDATSPVRDFLKNQNIHDYSMQESGPLHKVKLSSNFVLSDFTYRKVEASLYRSNTRGDSRIWFTDLPSFVSPNEVLILLNINNQIHIMNISRTDYSEFINKL